MKFTRRLARAVKRTVELSLWQSRYMVFIAVLASVLSAFILILIGSYDILIVLRQVIQMFSSQQFFEEIHKVAIKHIVSAVDVYLIATVLLIFGLGLYELFISRIDYMEKEGDKSSRILLVHTLDELKEKLAKVILMVLIVTFFKYAIEFHYGDVKTLLFLSIGVFLISLSIYFMYKGREEAN